MARFLFPLRNSSARWSRRAWPRTCYKFQFATLAGFHALNYGMFELATAYNARGMAAYSELQQAEFAAERHGYFDQVTQVISGGLSSTAAMAGSTEAAQF